MKTRKVKIRRPSPYRWTGGNRETAHGRRLDSPDTGDETGPARDACCRDECFGSCLGLSGSRECSGAGLTRRPPNDRDLLVYEPAHGGDPDRRGEAATGKSRGSSLWTHAYGPYGRPPGPLCMPGQKRLSTRPRKRSASGQPTVTARARRPRTQRPGFAGLT